MDIFNIQPISQALKNDLQKKIDSKTKPLGSLGLLEEIALKIGLIQETLSPQLNKPTIIVFAGDHGIAKEGVSAYPQEVTYQMVLNFLRGGAAINVFGKQHDIDIKIVDAGVNYELPSSPDFINGKIAYGTESFLKQPAMTENECRSAIQKGADIVQDIQKTDCNIIGFGEMGIGNTSSASVLLSVSCDLPIEECVGRGTGLDSEQLKHKINILKQAIDFHNVDRADPLAVLTTFGGFEIAMMCGAMLKAAELKMAVLVDGFISSASFLMAHRLYPDIFDYAIFCHQSDEHAHAQMLKALNATPILDLKMRLGEGSGAAVALPIIRSSIDFLNHMASFESASVSERTES